jgi:hypothetical protein
MTPMTTDIVPHIDGLPVSAQLNVRPDRPTDRRALGMTARQTRQGVRDLNPKALNGHRRIASWPHLPGPLGVVGGRYVRCHGGLPRELHRADDFGRRCLKCGEVCQ